MTAGQSRAIASLVSVLLLCLSVLSGQAQNVPPTNVAGIPVNYDEARVGTYTLPDPLVLAMERKCAMPIPGTRNGGQRSCACLKRISSVTVLPGPVT